MSGQRSRRSLVGLLAADGISRAGTVMSALALPWFVLVTTGDAALTGLVAAAEMLPLVLVQGLGGPIVDRVGPRRVAVVANLVAAVLVTLVPVLHLRGLLGPAVLVGLVALVGSARGAASATFVLVPGAAARAGVPIERATGLYDGIGRTAQMLGAPVAGVLLTAMSADTVLLVDAASFAVAGLLLHVTAPAGGSDAAPRAGRYLPELRAGLGFLRRDRTLVAIAVMIAVVNLLDMAYTSVLLPVWVHDELADPLGLGLVLGLFGVGALGGNLAYAWLGPRLPRRQVFAWSFVVGGAPRFAALALASTLPPVLLVVVVAGLACGALNPILGAVELERIPEHLRARVLGVVQALAWAGMPLGALVGGLAVGAAGLTGALWLLAGAYLVATLAPFVLAAFDGFDRDGGPVAAPRGAPEPAPTSAGPDRVDRPAASASR